MKKIYLLGITLLLMAATSVSFAQQFNYAKARAVKMDLKAPMDLKLPKAETTGPRAQNVFVELGGQGLLFTVNYDTRFGNRRDGLGGRAGIGYLAVDGEHVTTIPLSLNYLLGKGRSFFEIGLGATVVTAGSDDDSIIFDENGGNVVGTMSFAYRLQPVDKGFSLRAGFTPVFNGDFFVPYYAGVSLGYTF
ncbi:hypothetical protein [Hufsiella ginkgonis]|uniref:Outer membrane beta-barrel protein n=1 Tax=Hufsiella ginkgonis TaxID=2695274 RepID=A0A7K1XZ65_9SPHI|nr:hypothetical protein [Hufsiella ginkgonis]MXV15846.1 hypothetical protein [Hufsiella ginkgonis]